MKPRSRILAVDDDPMNLSVMEEILSDDYNLKTLDGGSRVVEVARAFRPDLVLLDIMMPDMSGYEVCRQLRAEASLRHLKVVLVSAKAMLSERLEGYEAGADDYVTKPFAIDEFLAKVRVHLRLKSVEEVDELKSDFLELLNHETRTPLTNIIAPAELLTSTEGLSEERRKQMSDMILSNARRLQALFEKVTLLSWLRKGEMELQCSPLDSVGSLRTAVRSLTDRYEGKEVLVEISGLESADVRADSGHLTTVFESILDNAIRFSPAGSAVKVSVEKDPLDVIFSIVDQGPGIDPKDLPHIFDGFKVADLDHHSSGHGLSLAIARSILDAIGGGIEVTSALGQGTCFTVRIPLAREERQAA